MVTRPKMKTLMLTVLCTYGFSGFVTSFASEPPPAGGYVCPPCYHVDNLLDTEIYEHDGECPVCQMSLIERRTLLDIDKVKLHAGSGNFLLKAGLAHPDKPIFVFYHKPAGFGPDSPMLLVIPGAGRNGWAYRDAWIDASETHNVLVLAPYYADDLYDFAAYHMGGVISDLELRNVELEPDGSAPSRYILDDEDIVFEPDNDPDEWIFGDFDAIFRHAVTATGSRRDTYDIFGHSAGGQILHRMAIFRPDSKADRIVAANSGFYTLPTHEASLPFGLREMKVSDQNLALAFSKDLVLLLGEADNENETRGTMLHTPLADQQGPGRLSRGRYFYRESQQIADSMGAAFNWRLEIVEGVGHDQRLMGRAAAEYLYGDSGSRKKK
jgi:pimeloyl-ACP methyl ester carboxylesterase